jgi:hypothetical protein
MHLCRGKSHLGQQVPCPLAPEGQGFHSASSNTTSASALMAPFLVAPNESTSTLPSRSVPPACNPRHQSVGKARSVHVQPDLVLAANPGNRCDFLHRIDLPGFGGLVMLTAAGCTECTSFLPPSNSVASSAGPACCHALADGTSFRPAPKNSGATTFIGVDMRLPVA